MAIGRLRTSVVSLKSLTGLRKTKADSSLTTSKLRPKKHKPLFGDPENYVWGLVPSE
jgi:hypothetical protein